MSSFEINKILASVLLALIVAWVSGLLASKLIEPKAPAHNAVAVATAPAQQAQPAGGDRAAPHMDDHRRVADPGQGLPRQARRLQARGNDDERVQHASFRGLRLYAASAGALPLQSHFV